MTANSSKSSFQIKFSNREVSAWGGMALLNRMLDEMGFRQAAGGWDLPPPGSNRGYTTITRVRQKLQKLASVSMRGHSLRHQFADNILAGGGSLYDVQMLLGHSDPRVSQRYAKLSMQALKEASSFGSIIVPKQHATTPPAPKEATVSQPEVGAVPECGMPSAQILEFPKAA